jgi:hypothetical protein
VVEFMAGVENAWQILYAGVFAAPAASAGRLVSQPGGLGQLVSRCVALRIFQRLFSIVGGPQAHVRKVPSTMHAKINRYAPFAAAPLASKPAVGRAQRSSLIVKATDGASQAAALVGARAISITPSVPPAGTAPTARERP